MGRAAIILWCTKKVAALVFMAGELHGAGVGTAFLVGLLLHFIK
jgi:hypothetical protein